MLARPLHYPLFTTHASQASLELCAFARFLREELCAFARPLREESAPGIREGMPALSPSKGSPLRLSPLESALPQNTRVTLLESALPNLKDLKSFRIRTYKKGGGRGLNC